jgi:anti-sigma factor RsiW
MNRDTLEKLMIDRRLGELPPESATLLDAYLEMSPADQSTARTIDETINLMKEAVAPIQRNTCAMPALDATRGTIVKHHSTLRIWAPRLAVAAAIALAFVLGDSRDWIVPGNQGKKSSPYLTAGRDSSAQDSIWSIDRLRSSKSVGEALGKNITWTSTAAWPQLGGRS